jgi:hypothetical protein
MGDVLALRMALASNKETMSSLMPPRNCLILLRVRLPWLRITRVTFYILLVILSTRLGEFMLKRLMLELALPSKMIQRGSESNANKVLAQEGD